MKVFEMVTYDPKSDACYVKISNQKIVDTIPKGSSCFVDFDKSGNIVGIEILNAKANKLLLQNIIQ